MDRWGAQKTTGALISNCRGADAKEAAKQFSDLRGCVAQNVEEALMLPGYLVSIYVGVCFIVFGALSVLLLTAAWWASYVLVRGLVKSVMIAEERLAR